MKEYRVGSLVRYHANYFNEDQPIYWLGVIVEVRLDRHFRIMWCETPHNIGLARMDSSNFEVIS